MAKYHKIEKTKITFCVRSIMCSKKKAYCLYHTEFILAKHKMYSKKSLKIPNP